MLAKSKPVSLVSKRVNANRSPMLYHTAQKSERNRNENAASSLKCGIEKENAFPSAEKSGRDLNQRSSTENSFFFEKRQD